ncbi:homocysteine S-methyltransferase family protein [Dyella subtropica]|uniref:homocysteine S-methyltransferase family protein n=1 Tax=Dyella subtropica TaxID=2992127 RepID=UPI0022530CC0|nr:homocysteine S-methyltransferase family protein [Dyella subtropica]
MQSKHADLPQLQGRLFMTDGGLGTTITFHHGMELPEFASFLLLSHERGRAALQHYYASYAELARTHATGLVLDSPTWRANRDWGETLGYDAHALFQANVQSIALLQNIRSHYATPANPIVIGGNVGPRGYGYRLSRKMIPREATDYHRRQIETLVDAGVDQISALTMNYPQEAIGIALAARSSAIPAIVSFTVETDGRLPSGESLPDAIARTDDCTGGYPAYYMVNCAHPGHFEPILRDSDQCRERIRGLRVNASCRSHAELDNCGKLDCGDPEALGRAHSDLLPLLPQLAVVGGCCGTDIRHVDAIYRHCSDANQRSAVAKA